MTDPLKNLSLPVVLFIVGLLVLFGFVVAVDRTHAATELWDTGNGDGTTILTGNTWVGIDRFPSSTITHGFTVSEIDMQLKVPTSGPAQTPHDWHLNVGYGYNPTSSLSSGITWMVTSTGSVLDLPSSTLAWKTFDFSPGFYVPDDANVYWRLYTSSSYLTAVGKTPTNPNGIVCTNNNCQPSYPLAYRLYASESFSGNESVSFRFPEEGTETPDFSNWILRVDGTVSSTNYFLKVHSVLATSTVTSSEEGTSYTDWSTFTGDQDSPYFPVPKPGTLTPNTDGIRYWTADVSLCADKQCLSVLDTDAIAFMTNFTSTIPDTPYTERAGPFHNPDDYLYSESGKKLTREQVAKWSTTGWCDPPATSTSWWGEYFSADHLSFGMCRFMEVLLKPDEKDYSAIGDAFDNIKKIYPFKYAWDIVDTAKDNAILPDTTLSPTLTLDMRTAFANDTASVTLLSSSTLSNLVGSEQTTNIKTTERYVIWSLVVGIIIKALLI